MVLSFASTQYSWSSTETNSFKYKIVCQRFCACKEKSVNFLYDYYNLFAHRRFPNPTFLQYCPRPLFVCSLPREQYRTCTPPPPLTVLDIPMEELHLQETHVPPRIFALLIPQVKYVRHPKFLCCTHWLRPRNPPSPLIWAHIRGRFWSASKDDISL